jgi:hypothetical protein
LAALGALVVQLVAAQPAVPELRYQPPPAFRPFSGNVEQAFRQTLLREWIDPRYRGKPVITLP